MEKNNLFEDMSMQSERIQITRFADLLTKDDRVLLENVGQGLDYLPLYIEAPNSEDLERNFNGN